ncbi:MAG: carbohydrate ABC transporter permease [Hydrogenophaga sp.]|jgi:multiple sugar transport system permease protein/sn-glycerol 3-phosphate transport system permease protein|uniref:carbohydrate ABC transporter permease n=1 Tax=Hydrogenophaga sp. TaxID=1904254 RepID=UPI001DE75426|nr:sugar ABC transporter permease [Hydrogenophaga sp.]MBW0169389.1 sugar ABC transporter permease [Hydrogenophaga sp.]MBW0183327.1 sugar ABC transporter permease [Hydrogenophaga sp.]
MNTLTLDPSMDTVPDLRRRARRRELLTAVVMLAPSLVFLAAFTYWPIARSLIYGFFDVQLGSTEIFYVGWENYQRLWHDALFWQSLRNTVAYMVVTVPTSIGLALVLAVALDRKLRGTSLYRSVFFYPVMVPSVAAGMVWVFLYAPGYGPINGLMELLGLPKLEWLYDRQWALPAIIFMSIWKYAGYFMLILLAALQLVPRDLYEAARLDGVSGFRQLVHITVPLISPTLYFVVIIGVLHSYQIFDYVFVMTQGGPADATNVLTFYIYQNAFQFQDIGTASAIANILLLVVMGLIGLVALTLGRRVHYMGR